MNNCIKFLFLFVSINQCLAMPGPYDGNSIGVQALWHFDQTAIPGSSYRDATGIHNMVEFGSPQLKDAAGLVSLGRSLKGFTSTGAIECLSLTDTDNQTFEAWIKWDDSINLPQNFSGVQIVMANIADTTYSSRLYFVNNELFVDIRRGNLSSHVKTLRVPVLAEVDKWYHVAFSIRTGDLDNDASFDDVQLKLYWNDENNITTNPLPVMTADYINFNYRADATKLRIGKQYINANDQFRGEIDEIRIVNGAHNKFDTFQSGDLSRYSGKKVFFVGHDIEAPNMPNLNFFKIPAVPRLSHVNKFWNSSDNMNTVFPREANVRAEARLLTNVNNLYYLDVEHLPTRFQNSVDRNIDSIQKMASIADWVHSEKPHVRIGYYGELPQREYWNRTDEWRERNTLFNYLAQHVDVVFPSLYTFYPDRFGWVNYAIENLKEARKYNKPVYAFIRPVYHESTENAGLLIPGDYWRLQLETIYQHADGIVIWARFQNAGWPYVTSPTDPNNWWYQTLDFMHEKRIGIYSN